MWAQDVHLYSASTYMEFPLARTGQEAVWAQSVALLVCRSDKYLFHYIMNGSRICHQSMHTHINNYYQMRTKMLIALSLQSLLGSCVWLGWQ